jgi:glycosyltransferase involved in cell wall biosynthesis
MRVAFLSFDFGEYSVRLANALAEHASVLLLLNEALAAPFIADLDARVRYQPVPRVRYRQPLRQLRRNRWLIQQLCEFGAEVLHVQQGSMWFNIGLQFEHRFPVVLTVHDAQRHIGDKLSRKTPYFFSKLGFHRADQIIAHNNYVSNMLKDQLGIPPEKLHIIPHIQLGQGKTMPPAPEDSRTVLFFGRIWPYKGLEYLIRAEPWITGQIPDVKIVIAGHGENFDRYRRMMVHPERFLILNRHIDEEEASRLFQEASVVVLPYVESSQSGVIPIAYTYGKPVVASAVGGLPEMVDDGATGLLVPPRDERKLAEAIVTVLTDDARRHRMGERGKKKIECECAPAVIARHTLNVYRAALLGAQQPIRGGFAQKLARSKENRKC